MLATSMACEQDLKERTFSSATVDANLLACLDEAVHNFDAARRAAGRNIITGVV